MLNKKLMGVLLGTAILASAGTYSSANAEANNIDTSKKVIVVQEQSDDFAEPYKLKALWNGAKAVGSAAKAAYDVGISAADKVGMWLVGGSEVKTDTATPEEMEVIFDK